MPETDCDVAELQLSAAVPVLFVRDVRTSAAFYRDALGFDVDFVHGDPPFYGSVSRDGATLHLKWISEPVYASGRVETEGLIMAFLPAHDVTTLYSEYIEAQVRIRQNLTKQAWGGTDFHVVDPDGNVLAFVG